MSPPRWLDAAALAAALPMADAVDAVGEAFAADAIAAPPRDHHAVPGGTLLVMPAAGPAGTGVKLVTIAPGNPDRGLPLISGVYVLFEPDGLTPAALLDGAALTALRTGAVSGLAARHLARQDAAHLVVLGAGAQARSHVAAMRAVRPVTRVTVVSRTAARAGALVAELRADGLDAREGTPEAVREADLVAACTTSPTPVVRGADLPPGVHVTAVGAYTARTRELDTAAVVGSRLVVEDRDVALAEAGDVRIPVEEGALTRDAVAADLRELVAGAPVRRTADDRTTFKSVGMALEDLAVAVAALRRLG